MYRTTSAFLFLTVVSGTIIVLSSEKWFMIWVGLELSTLAMVPILCSKFSPRKMEATVKYFLIQALSAALLLKSALIKAWLTGSWSILYDSNKISTISLAIALALKMGLAPCHFWFPDVLQGLPFMQGLMVATWQKIAPLIILFSFSQLNLTNLFIFMGLISVLVGGWGGLKQTQMRKILAFSSMGKMGWMVVTSTYSFKAALVMLVMYLIMKTAMFLIANLLSLSTLGHLNIILHLSPISIFLIILSMLSLGGLPPLTGFMVKFISLSLLVNEGFLVLSTILLAGSLLSLFFYLRMAFNASLMLFPQHIMGLTSWRNKMSVASLNLKTWLTSTFFMLGTFAIPLTLPLYMSL